MMINNIMIDVLPLLLLILSFYKAKIVKPYRVIDSTEYLSIETGKAYRGLFALVVIFHHLFQMTESGILFRVFLRSGFLAVAVFFFLSGYGLQKSYLKKKDAYRKGFLSKRIPSILIPYIIITALYWLVDHILGHTYSIDYVFESIAKGDPIVDYSWYIITIIVFYVVFWILMVVCRKHYLLMIIGAVIWNTAFVWFCIQMSYENYWYTTSHLLIIGMIWATKEEDILKFISKMYWIVSPVIWFFTFAFIALGPIIETRIDNSGDIIRVITAVLFVLSFILLSLKVKIGNKPLRFLGEISLELYLSQGLFIKLFRNDFIYIEKNILWCVLVLVCTIGFSALLHVLFKFILNKYFALVLKVKQSVKNEN